MDKSFDIATSYKDIDSLMIDKNTPQAARHQLPKLLEKVRDKIRLKFRSYLAPILSIRISLLLRHLIPLSLVVMHQNLIVQPVNPGFDRPLSGGNWNSAAVVSTVRERRPGG